MDEELPITIFIVSRCTSKQFFSNLEYVNLYRKAREIVNNEELDYEEKTITNVVVQIFNNILQASGDYISSEWKLEDIE